MVYFINARKRKKEMKNEKNKTHLLWKTIENSVFLVLA